MKKKAETVILIVEDEGLIALDLMEFLAREGYRVLEPVSTGEEAVLCCGGSPRPDLVLMDVHLAGKTDGIETTRRIREKYPVPVIILTACDDGMTGTRMKDLVPDGILVKPATRSELLSAISLVLESHGRQSTEKSREGLCDASMGTIGSKD